MLGLCWWSGLCIYIFQFIFLLVLWCQKIKEMRGVVTPATKIDQCVAYRLAVPTGRARGTLPTALRGRPALNLRKQDYWASLQGVSAKRAKDSSRRTVHGIFLKINQSDVATGRVKFRCERVRTASEDSGSYPNQQLHMLCFNDILNNWWFYSDHKSLTVRRICIWVSAVTCLVSGGKILFKICHCPQRSFNIFLLLLVQLRKITSVFDSILLNKFPLVLAQRINWPHLSGLKSMRNEE